MYRDSAAVDRSILVVAFSGHVFGVDRASGEIRWAHDIEGGGDIELHVEGRVVIAANHRRIVFLEYSTGEEIRGGELPTGSGGRTTMMVDEENVYVARGGQVYCYGLGGKAKWKQVFGDKGIGTVALGFPGATRQSDSA
jgi:outer membrane protein assembly factor BamB